MITPSKKYHAGFKNDERVTQWSRDRGKVYDVVRRMLREMSPEKRKAAKIGIQTKRFIEAPAEDVEQTGKEISE